MYYKAYSQQWGLQADHFAARMVRERSFYVLPGSVWLLPGFLPQSMDIFGVKRDGKLIKSNQKLLFTCMLRAKRARVHLVLTPATYCDLLRDKVVEDRWIYVNNKSVRDVRLQPAGNNPFESVLMSFCTFKQEAVKLYT